MRFGKAINAGFSVIGQLAIASGLTPPAPFFVIGTGRCGSSLLVKILDSHPQLVGYLSEANELWHPNSYPFATKSIDTPPIVEDPALFTKKSLNSWPNQHDRKIQATLAGHHFRKGLKKKIFVKSAMISFMVPQLLLLYPKAKFIHIYRNGPSVVESFLKKEWGKYRDYFGVEDEYRLCCAKYWNACLMEIEHQKRALTLEESSAFLEFSYEQLCDSPTETLGEIGCFLSVSPAEFAFDTSQIVSQNYKVGAYSNEEKWAELSRIMRPAMKLKVYL
ncbi:MAG: sulfotransferase [Chloroflexota bacterium]